MTKKTVYILMILCSYMSTVAQTGPQFTHYIFNSFYINPGSTGIHNKTIIQANLKSQYTGYQSNNNTGGDIQSTVLSVNMPSSKIKGGLGIYVSNHNFSKVQTDQEIALSYAFHKRINYNVIGLGISAGMLNKKFSGENFRPRDPNDPLIPLGNINVAAPNLSIGGYLFNPNYEIGLSVKNLMQPKFKINNTTGAQELRQINAMAKTNIGVSYLIDISPMVSVKSDLKSVSTELGLLMHYNQKYWAGLNYRWQDSGSILIGGNLKSLKLGYALDLITLGKTAKSAMSHEMFIRYEINPTKLGKKSIIKTPRYNF